MKFVLRFQLAIIQHWFRLWLGAEKATWHYLNQRKPDSLTHISGTRGRWVKINQFSHGCLALRRSRDCPSSSEVIQMCCSNARIVFINLSLYIPRAPFTPWVAIQASRCAGWVDRILAVNNSGVSLCPSNENGGRVVPPGTIAVSLQYIPGEKGVCLSDTPIWLEHCINFY